MNSIEPRKSPFVPTQDHAAPLTGPLPVVSHEPTKCWCGCGESVSEKAFYRPGHDSRHVGIVARQVAELDEFNTITDQLPTKALQLKAWNMAYRLHVEATKKTTRRRPAHRG